MGRNRQGLEPVWNHGWNHGWNHEGIFLLSPSTLPGSN